MFTDEKINYTSYLRNKPQETNRARLTDMKTALVSALKALDIHGHISAKYYTDGNIEVHLNGCYFGMFDSVRNKFFSGFVGDY